MSSALPVMAAAYERLLRRPDDPYGLITEPEREEADTYAAKANTLVVQSCGNIPASGTLPTQDLLFAMTQDNSHARLFFTGVRDKPESASYWTTENVTGVILIEAVEESLKGLSRVFEKTHARALAANTPASTSLYSATQYCAAPDSRTAKLPVEDRYTWLKIVYELVRTGQSSKALRLIYASVEDHFKRDDLRGLNEVLAGVDVSRLNAQTMTALLRISGRGKRALLSWSRLLERTKVELARLRVADIQGLLVGLGS